ncbi:MAG: threonine ammonia-lyase [Actinobacteria bacterium]|nr:threonine ammonia-lyase [Actinomycetota bacterium]
MALPVTESLVAEAAARIRGHVVATPCTESRTLSAITGARVFLKWESLQFTGSFKDRGAANRLLTLTPDERRRGVVAMSAGNHAQGVAHVAAALGVPATIVMPETTPFVKVARTRALGARVETAGATVADAATVARRIADEEGLVLVHPYDDPLVIAGQGTVGPEILDAVPDADAIVAPVGGGGLLAGIAAAVRPSRPRIDLVGVQTVAYPEAARRFHPDLPGPPGAGRPPTVADGIAVPQPGVLTGEVIAALVDDVTTVSEAAIEDAITRLLEIEKALVEGAGAAPLALLLEQPDRFADRTVVLVCSGGNIDPRLLSTVLLRGLGRQGRLTRLLVEIDDAPGRLAAVATVLGEAGANIVEVDHRRLAPGVSARRTLIALLVETLDDDHTDRVADALAARGFPARREPL